MLNSAIYQLYTICILLAFFCEKVLPEANFCYDMRLKSAVLASSCCALVKPTLDPGYNECFKELLPSLPQNRPLTRAEKLAINICVEECNYIGNGYIDAEPPYNMDLDNINENIEKFAPEPKVIANQFLLLSYKRCEQFCQSEQKVHLDIRFPDVDIINHICSAYAMRLTTCVRIIAMHECPTEFYANTTECEQAKLFFKECIATIPNVSEG